MTVSQELREWAMQTSFPLFSQLSFEAWAKMMMAASSSTGWGPYMDNMHRRILALLVACVLEDES